MKFKLNWKIMLAFIIVITAFYINYLYYRPKVIEGLDFNNFFTKFKKATGEAQATSSYEQFIGWIYSHPEASGNALNDLKTRAFQPTCEFNVNWSDQLPSGLGRPVAPANKELANVAYKSWLDCLGRSDQSCINQLNDAMRRFMAPGCSFQTGKPISTYNAKYKPVF